MALKLRHSHIAIRRTLGSLAQAINAVISDGEDDLGKYRYFDLTVSHEDGNDQQIRFASHVGDQMVHMLAERIDMVSDLAAALFAVGVGSRVALSISVSQEGQPARSADEIKERIAAMSMSTKSGHQSLEIVAGHDGRHPTLPRVAMH
jgi:hypothetical protein